MKYVLFDSDIRAHTCLTVKFIPLKTKNFLYESERVRENEKERGEICHV